MIATHTPKMFNARLKQQAVRARIIGDVPESLISSRSVTMLRELWAAPTNAAEMKTWREAAQTLPEDSLFSPDLPGIIDTQLKQLLVPIDWQADHYLSVTPLASMGVVHDIYQRLHHLNLPFRKWVIQPTPAAMANHGEALLMQGGSVRMLRRGPAKIEQGGWRGDFVQLTARCERMNISSGMVAVGFPAITAIGGMVHTIERATGLDIDFAFGMRAADWVSGVPKFSVSKTPYGARVGRVKGGTVKPVPAYSAEEITANCEIVLLMKGDRDLEAITTALKRINRIAGGSLFDVDISVKFDSGPPLASYLIDASSDVSRLLSSHEAFDSLDAALKMYGKDGSWTEEGWYQPRNGYTLNMSGYAFLEKPKRKEVSRGNYPHAWAEPVFTLITQGSMSDAAWWRRSSSDWGVSWHG